VSVTPAGRSLVFPVLLIACLFEHHAAAQTKLFALFPGATCAAAPCAPSTLLEIDVDGRRIVQQAAVLHARGYAAGPAVTADGRLVAWVGAEQSFGAAPYLSIFEPARRVQDALFPLAPTWSGGSLFADPAAIRLYGQLFAPRTAISVFEAQGLRRIDDPCLDVLLRGISADGARLLASCTLPFPAMDNRILALDAATGTIAGEARAPVGTIAFDDSGSFFYSASNEGRTSVALGRYRLSDGQASPVRVIPGVLVAGALVHEGRSGRLYLLLRDTAKNQERLHVFDAATLDGTGQVAAPFAEAGASIVPDPDKPVVYVLWSSSVAGGSRSRVSIYETAGLTPVAEADLSQWSSSAAMVLSPRPPRGTALQAAVNGSTVSLTWRQEGRTLSTGTIVEAGSGPGLSNLAVLTLPPGQTSLTVPNVARGTYYVRIRPVNGSGPGDASNEVTVSVP
jgi:hypothetical protein